jgi:hypothetical protein
MKTLKLVALMGVLLLNVTACDGGRYSVARNHVTGEDCYVLDWQDGERLPATQANIKLADGDYFWADPQQCQ